jgi:anaerobic dimethyl sulfoxide reductase subunit A
MEKMKRFGEKGLNRRDFLKSSAAASAALGLAGCGSKLKTVESIAPVEKKEGKWIPAACWIDCGGRCVNQAYVVDGIIVRQKTDDSHPDSPDFPQQRGCVRGRSQRNHVLAPDRLKYPMKRKHWQPGGGDRSLRGRDEWERISWNMALDYIAGELKRVLKDYGNNSVLCTDPMKTEPINLMNLLGGCSTSFMTASYGAWQSGARFIGSGYDAIATCNDRMDLLNSEVVVLWGMNPAWSSGGNPSYHLLQIKKAGAKIIGIDPMYNDTFSALDAEWIPIRPGTDMALLFAMAYILITEDNPKTNPLIDWDTINRCTVGFDADRLPKGVDKKENFKDYVLGTYDGIQKDPKWAYEICGVDPETTRRLIQNISRNKKVALMAGYAPSRTFNTDNLPQLFMTLGAMTGHIGKSGHMTGIGNFIRAINGGPDIAMNGEDHYDLYSSHSGGFTDPRHGSPIPLREINVLECKELWNNAIPNKKYKDFSNALFDDIQPALEREVDIRIIWSAFSNYINCFPNPNLAIAGLRKNVDLIVRQDFNFTPTAQYADIVLPAITPWERPGGMAEFWYHSRESVFFYFQVMQPLFEARDDQWIVKEVAKRMGYTDEDLFPISRREQEFVHLHSARVMKEDGSVMPMVTVTQKDIDGWGLDGLKKYAAKTGKYEIKPQKGEMTIEDMKRIGCYQAKRSKGDAYTYIPLKEFYEDPVKNPLDTESGMIEIYSKSLADMLNSVGYTTIKPYPTYIVPIQGYETTFSDFKNKVKGKYPYQVINPHYMGRQHSTMNTVKWLREAFASPVYISAQDAREKGFKDGDTILLTSEVGKTIRRACVTERLMPGCVALPHGDWLDIDPETGIDRGGHDNVLVTSKATGQAQDCYNSTLVNMVKYTGKPLPKHVDEPVKIVF